ncbi:MAG: type I polyketide synthase, partial [Rhodocyclaceae bacterium]
MAVPDSPTSLAGLSPLKLALLAQQIRAQSEPVLRADPIAIIGLGCRLPGGVNDPEAFWELLRNGVDAVGALPSGRWNADALYDPDPAGPGKIATKGGGFLKEIDRFDAAYFGILPREAEHMDPQQRLFLEVAIEALDHAGLTREKLAGSRTGAFVASYYNEYAQMQYADPACIDARTLTGTVHSVLVNRLSYLLDLRGPSVSVDTACSSSLVAIHLACQSLRHGECDIALAGGVSLMVSESQMISLSKVGFMAPDGRCKTFDASADGFGRGEGCSIIVMKRLADALADGDRVLALVRGSAVNQDGHSTVLAAPNGLAQQALIREALANAQVEPARIGYVEAHGTGTALGDPIEVEALAATVGQPAPGAGPCLIGAAKANVAHLEAAAGATGVIKSVLMLQHGEIPPLVHFKTLNPHISLAGTRLAVPTKLMPWPAGAQPRCIGTSGFGVGGTNAHVILEEAPRLSAPEAPAYVAAPWLLPLSAQGEPALRVLAERWADFLGTSQVPLPALCATAGERRSHLDHRLAVVGDLPEQMVERLRAFAASGTVPAGAARGRRSLAGPLRVAFVFSGQGQQWLGMGRELMDREPVFRAALADVDAQLRRHVTWSLLAELAAAPEQSRLDDTEVAQPAIFGVQVALAALWAHWGIRPDGVVGHSVGEIAALHVAGSLALDEAVRIVVQRARFMQRATGQGAMAAVGLSEAAAREAIAGYGERLSVAAINGPGGVVLSGESGALAEVLAALERQGVSQRALPVNYAFHSAQMLAHAEALVAALGNVAAGSPSLPVYSTVTGRVLDDAPVDAAYFGRNVRQAVRFADAITAMLDDGFTAFVEIAAHPVLAASVAECAEARHEDVLTAASLRRGRPEREAMLNALAALYAVGRTPDWPALQGAAAEVHDLPAYPWQRERYWLRPSAPQAGAPTATVSGPTGLLARQLPIAGVTVFETAWPDEAPAWLADHRVAGRLLMPGMAMLEALRQAAVEALAAPQVVLEDFVVLQPLVLAEGEGERSAWQVVVSEPEVGRAAATLFGNDPAAPGRWRKVASALVRLVTPADAVAASFPAIADGAATNGLYDAFAAIGVDFGPAFHTV